jgi:hypothetical protein
MRYEILGTLMGGKTKPKQTQLKPIQTQLKPIQTQFKPNKAKNKPNSNPICRKRKNAGIYPEFIPESCLHEPQQGNVSSLSLAFTLDVCLLAYLSGIGGAFAWIRSLTIVLIILLADFTTLKGGRELKLFVTRGQFWRHGQCNPPVHAIYPLIWVDWE